MILEELLPLSKVSENVLIQNIGMDTYIISVPLHRIIWSLIWSQVQS